MGRAGVRGVSVLVRDWAPMVVLLCTYELMRGLAPLAGAPVRDLAGLERWLCGGQQVTLLLQAAFYRPGRVAVQDVVATLVYFMHFVMPALVGIWLWLDDRRRFRAFAASLLVTSALAFLTYVAMPTAPPWLGHPADVHQIMSETIRQLHVPGWLVSAYSHRDYNVDAAFPSLHSAFPLIATAHAWSRDRRLGLALAGWTFVVWLSVLYLGEHYVIDIAGGVVYATAGVLAVVWWRRRRTGRPAPTLAVEPV